MERINNEDAIDTSKIQTCEEPVPEKKPLLVNVLTGVAFLVGLCVCVIVGLSFILTKITKNLWILYLSIFFPRYKFVMPDSVRTLLDTHRNQGIINILMTIKGVCNIDVVKKALEDHIVERRNKKEELLFPILRLRLVSCWGNYAWAYADEFDINNHVLLGSSHYRGRPLSEKNLQEYVSGITSKFLLSVQPPWQIIVIPNILSTEPTYGILVRVHHLILEEGNLNIGDFLCLKPESEQFIDIDGTCELNEFDNSSPLTELGKSSKALSTLRNRLNDSISNHWNEFISVFDPITSPKLFNTSPGFIDCMAIIFISIVCAYKDTRKYIEYNKNPICVIPYTLRAFNHERRKRMLFVSTLLFGLFKTFNPVSLFINFVKTIMWLNVKIYIKLPLQLYYEYLALKSFIRKKFCSHPNTLVGVLCDYLPLICKSVKQIYDVIALIYTAPYVIIREMFFMNKNLEHHELQQNSSSGRKVVAWSEPVSRKYIEEIAIKENVTETEILLTMVSECIREYFHHSHLRVPNTVSTITKVVSYDKLLSTHDQKCENEKSKGIVFLILPMNKICLGKCHDEIRNVSTELRRVIKCQIVVYLLTSLQNFLTEILPSVYVRVFLNFINRKFSITILEVTEGRHNSYGLNRMTLWNDTVTSMFYWRPPQSNTAMSLTVQRYGNSVRLNVMTDSLLTPKHHVPARYWGKAARKLHGHSHENHNVAGSSSSRGPLQLEVLPQEESHDLPAGQNFNPAVFSSPVNRDTETQKDSEEYNVNNPFLSSTDESYSSGSLSVSPTSYIYDYHLNSAYTMDDFIRDTQFDEG